MASHAAEDASGGQGEEGVLSPITIIVAISFSLRTAKESFCHDAPIIVSPRDTLRWALMSIGGCASRRHQGQPDGEGGSFLGETGGIHRAPMRFDNLLHDIEAKARTFGLRGI